nr:MAG TPA: Regulator of stationary/sporulation gene expression [Bacteriophage sp.]
MKLNRNYLGAIKKVDCLGRIVIPKDLRNYMNLKTGNSVEIIYDKSLEALVLHSVHRNEIKSETK